MMKQRIAHVYILIILSQIIAISQAFTSNTRKKLTITTHRPHKEEEALLLNYYQTTSTQLSYASKNRDIILRREGTHFKLNRFSGRVEFGSTANLITSFDNADMKSVQMWLSDEKQVAMSIWDEKLIRDLGNNMYRLKLMKLQFVTITLAPEVDNRMWTEQDTSLGPVFKLQSMGFDPKIQLAPGLNIPASSLKIDIEVVGELKACKNGKGVEGKIAFLSSGDLPPPLRLLPEPALKAASDTICKTVSDFAIKSFQMGARNKYREFLLSSSRSSSSTKD